MTVGLPNVILPGNATDVRWVLEQSGFKPSIKYLNEHSITNRESKSGVQIFSAGYFPLPRPEGQKGYGKRRREKPKVSRERKEGIAQAENKQARGENNVQKCQ